MHRGKTGEIVNRNHRLNINDNSEWDFHHAYKSHVIISIGSSSWMFSGTSVIYTKMHHQPCLCYIYLVYNGCIVQQYNDILNSFLFPSFSFLPKNGFDPPNSFWFPFYIIHPPPLPLPSLFRWPTIHTRHSKKAVPKSY